MKSLFNLDNPFMQALARIGDLMMQIGRAHV